MCSTYKSKKYERDFYIVPREGIEPPTPASSGQRSTTELPWLSFLYIFLFFKSLDHFHLLSSKRKTMAIIVHHFK